jgi:hypothetical protein
VQFSRAVGTLVRFSNGFTQVFFVLEARRENLPSIPPLSKGGARSAGDFAGVKLTQRLNTIAVCSRTRDCSPQAFLLPATSGYSP